MWAPARRRFFSRRVIYIPLAVSYNQVIPFIFDLRPGLCRLRIRVCGDPGAREWQAVNTPTPKPRQYYIDWLRVIAIFLVFVYHSLRVFGSEDYHVMNTRSYAGVDVVEGILPIFGMPLVFLISGASAYYALGKRGGGRYLWERVLRLLVPFVVGMVTYIPLLVYLERVSHGDFEGSFVAFMGQYLDGLYAFGGDFAWMGLHLWYLALLFLFTLLTLPLLAWLRHAAAGQRSLAWCNRLLARRGAIYLMALPLLALGLVLNPDLPWGIRRLGGWTLWEYLLLFVYGFLLVAGEEVQANIRRQRWVLLVIGVASLVVNALLPLTRGEVAFGTTAYALDMALTVLSAWCLLLAVWGFSMVHLNFGNHTLFLANEAVLPFYIMHQTFIVILAFFVVAWPIPDLLKYVLIAGGTLLLMFVLHFGLIRRNNVLRVLFGLTPLPAVQQHPAPVRT